MIPFDYTNTNQLIVLALAIVIVVLLFIVLRHKVIDYSRQRQARKRFARGNKLELDAKSFLQNKGYTILDYQGTYEHHYLVDGVDHTATIQPDYMVKRKGKTYIVEVKSGTSAISAQNRHTRRQLLEYDYVIENDGVLLLDMENHHLQVIQFRTKAQKHSTTLLKGVIAVALVAIFIPYWPIKIAIGVILAVVFLSRWINR